MYIDLSFCRIMQPESTTGYGTVVFTSVSQNDDEYAFRRFNFTLKPEFGQQEVTDSVEVTDEDVLTVLDDILVRNRSEKLVKRQPKDTNHDTINRNTHRGVTYRNHINKKRAKAAELLLSSEKVNFTKIARLTRMTYERVRAIYNEIRIKGDYEEFKYPNQHSIDEKEALEKDI